MTDKTNKIIEDLLEEKLKFSFDEYPKQENTVTCGELLRTWVDELKVDT